MKTIWTVIGVIVLLAIILVIYRGLTNKKMMVMPKTPAIEPTPKNLSTNTTQKTVDTIVIQPVYVQTSINCNSQSYQDGVLGLFDTYRQKRVIYNNGLNSNDPNTIQYHKDMNDAYNAYLNEADKCRFYIG